MSAGSSWMGTILWPGVHPGISFEVSMKGQAKKGGEIGINGEYYKGGQFMPGSSKTKKGDRASSASPSAKPKRQLIEPGVFGKCQGSCHPLLI
ncbi:hypothetical protein [Proteus terrae]|uniref:hypothetical protein n=1 Tax=Proteus terrae TaxID=1574161 RepID=UPI0032DAA7BD